MTYLKCPRRYWLRYVVGVPEMAGGEGVGENDEGQGDRRGLQRGRLVHEVLALPDPGAPATVDRVLARHGPEARQLRQDVRRHVGRFLDSDLAKQAAAAGEARRELPFRVNLGSLPDGGDLVAEGQMDLVWRSGTQWYVVDYKTNDVSGARAAGDEIARQRYDAQMKLYTLAADRLLCTEGEQVEPVLFFTQPACAKHLRVAGGDLAAFAGELAAFGRTVRAWGGTAPPRADGCGRQRCPFRDSGICAAETDSAP
jgi:ATP-dependent exoDNAse (exonuclease V) beta subunit